MLLSIADSYIHTYSLAEYVSLFELTNRNPADHKFSTAFTLYTLLDYHLLSTIGPIGEAIFGHLFLRFRANDLTQHQRKILQYFVRILAIILFILWDLVFSVRVVMKWKVKVLQKWFAFIVTIKLINYSNIGMLQPNKPYTMHFTTKTNISLGETERQKKKTKVSWVPQT